MDQILNNTSAYHRPAALPSLRIDRMHGLWLVTKEKTCIFTLHLPSFWGSHTQILVLGLDLCQNRIQKKEVLLTLPVPIPLSAQCFSPLGNRVEFPDSNDPSLRA
jgi:hypothetical protein